MKFIPYIVGVIFFITLFSGGILYFYKSSSINDSFEFSENTSLSEKNEEDDFVKIQKDDFIPETKEVITVSGSTFSSMQAVRKSIVLQKDKVYDQEYGVTITIPNNWKPVLNTSYTNTDNRQVELQEGETVIAKINPTNYSLQTFSDAYKADKGESVIKERKLPEGTLYVVGIDNSNEVSVSIFWGYQYADGTWQVVKDLFKIGGLSDAEYEKRFGWLPDDIKENKSLPLEDIRSITDSVLNNVVIEPKVTRDRGRITELVTLSTFFQFEKEGINKSSFPRTSTIPKSLKSHPTPFPEHNYNGVSINNPYGWISNLSYPDSYCLYTRLEVPRSQFEYFMISEKTKSDTEKVWSMEGGVFVSRPPKEFSECLAI